MIVLVADVLHDFVAHPQRGRVGHLEGPGVRARVIDRDLVDHVAEILPRPPLDDVLLRRPWIVAVQRMAVVEADGVDDERVALEPADRMAVPRRIQVGRDASGRP